jgi:hypothetical protein
MRSQATAAFYTSSKMSSALSEQVLDVGLPNAARHPPPETLEMLAFVIRPNQQY